MSRRGFEIGRAKLRQGSTSSKTINGGFYNPRNVCLSKLGAFERSHCDRSRDKLGRPRQERAKSKINCGADTACQVAQCLPSFVVDCAGKLPSSNLSTNCCSHLVRQSSCKQRDSSPASFTHGIKTALALCSSID